MRIQKLSRSFYLESAVVVAPLFLGKYLVYNSKQGRLSGMISEVEAYPAFSDDVSHGNRRTRRTEIMYCKGGYTYVYLIYGIHYQFAAVVNKKNVPEVVFIRALIPCEGIDIMKSNFGKTVKNEYHLTQSPGNVCKSFGLTLDQYGMDLTTSNLFIEDRNVKLKTRDIIIKSRVGIKKSIKGSEKELNFTLHSDFIKNHLLEKDSNSKSPT